MSTRNPDKSHKWPSHCREAEGRQAAQGEETHITGDIWDHPERQWRGKGWAGLMLPFGHQLENKGAAKRKSSQRRRGKSGDVTKLRGEGVTRGRIHLLWRVLLSDSKGWALNTVIGAGKMEMVGPCPWAVWMESDTLANNTQAPWKSLWPVGSRCCQSAMVGMVELSSDCALRWSHKHDSQSRLAITAVTVELGHQSPAPYWASYHTWACSFLSPACLSVLIWV